jgi:hypothetical protein
MICNPVAILRKLKRNNRVQERLLRDVVAHRSGHSNCNVCNRMSRAAKNRTKIISSPEEFHLEALPEPDVRLSTHTVRRVAHSNR